MENGFLLIWLLVACVLLLDTAILYIRYPAKKVRKMPDIVMPDTGRSMTIGGREIQEDQTGCAETAAGILAVLADGAGKAYGGRIASRIAVDTCMDIFSDYNAFHNPQYFFRKAFHRANKEILKALGDDSRGSASLGCAMVREGFLYYALVGNVRIAVYREGNLVPVSSGHTFAVLAEQKFREGTISREDALRMLENRRLYNYLGQDGFRDIELFDAPVRMKPGDIVVLMSDGVYELIGTREIEAVLGGSGDCQRKAYDIIELVNQNPKEDKDNASIVLLGMGDRVGTYEKAEFRI